MKIAAVVFVTMTACRLTVPMSQTPRDTDRDISCVLTHLAALEKFDSVRDACTPKDDKRLVAILAMLEKSEVLFAEKADVSVWCSIDLHEANRRGYAIQYIPPLHLPERKQ